VNTLLVIAVTVYVVMALLVGFALAVSQTITTRAEKIAFVLTSVAWPWALWVAATAPSYEPPADADAQATEPPPKPRPKLRGLMALLALACVASVAHADDLRSPSGKLTGVLRESPFSPGRYEVLKPSGKRDVTIRPDPFRANTLRIEGVGGRTKGTIRER